MSFLDNFNRSWSLVKLSWHVLMQDKELLLFPILSGIGALVMLVLILTPLGFLGGLTMPAFILWYFVASFIVIFHNAAIIACVRKRMHGGDPTVGYGYSEAFKHIGAILVWSAISTTVGLILRQLERAAEDNFLARIAISLLGMAWTLVTFFTLPFIVIEGVSAFGSIKRSAALFKKTWGEQVIATSTIGLGFLLFWLLGIAVAAITIFTASSGVFIVMALILMAYFLVLIVVQSALSAILTGVLYSYATGDNIPREFKDVAGTLFVKNYPKGA